MTLPALVLFVFSIAFVARTVVHYRGHPYLALFDDGMISMRYAHNLATGHGLVWNAGAPPVEGYTNFGWTLWMALLHLVGLPPWLVVMAVIASAVLLTICGLWLVRRIAEELAPGDRRCATVAVWLTALAYPLAFWALRGMEVAALAWCTSAMTLLALRLRRDPLETGLLVRLVAVITIAILIRTDAVIVCAIAVAATVSWAPSARERWRRARIAGGALVGVLAAHTAFRIAYYGDPLPNTYYLKIAGTGLAERMARGTASAAALATAGLFPLVVLAIVGVWGRLRRRESTSGPLLLMVAMAVAPAAYSVYVGGDAWEWFLFANRYQAISLPIVCVLAALGGVRLLGAPLPIRRRALMGAAAAVLAAAVLAGRNMPPTGSLQYLLPGSQELADRTVLAVLAAVVCITLAVGNRKIGVAALTLTVALVLDGVPMSSWIRTGGPHVDDDATMALYGLVVRDSTTPAATVAVMWAGASPYYSGRPSVDLLGKSDRVIAHESPQRVPFYPGHTKWDYTWSVGRLRPDLVADIFRDTPAVDMMLRGFGYDELAPKIWVRHDSTTVDRTALLRGLAANPRIQQLVTRHL